MKYVQRTFTLPASSNTPQVRWDLAFLSAKEFKTKYNETPDVYIQFFSYVYPVSI